MGTLHHALECAGRGWAVFPAGLNKIPRTPNGHKAASTDPERIRAMWLQFGGSLVGVATGEASNVAVLDIDRQHGGLEWWGANRHRLPHTRVHRTRSGGLHLWFRHKQGLRCSTARIAPGIDVKAEGGACIYWPAIGLPVLSDAPLAAWPEWLTPPPRRETAPVVRSSERPPAHIEKSLTGIVRVVATAAPGQRNAILFWGACRCAEMVTRGELSKPHAEAVLRECAGRVGLDHIEAAATIRSAFMRSAA